MHLFTSCVLIQFKSFFTLCRNYLNQKSCWSLQRGEKKNLFILLKSFAIYMKTDITDYLYIPICLPQVQLILHKVE